MPQVTKNAPDWVDVQNLLGVLGENHKAVVYFTTRVRAEVVEVIGKTHGAPYTPDAPILHVALVSFPLTKPRDMAQVCYTLCFDLWCQHDGGGATAAKRGAPVGWNGRVEVPRGRNR